MPPADIAARFGVTDKVVEKHLKLARVSPAIIAAYRDGKLDLEQVMVFGISDDRSAEEKPLKTPAQHGRRYLLHTPRTNRR